MVAYIGLGSNLGDSKRILQDSWRALGEVEGIALDGLSSPYMTAPVGMTSNHLFTNAVGRLRVTLTPLELLQSLLTVEASFGRLRKERSFGYQDRSLDLDLLYYGDVAMDSPELILPHPRMHKMTLYDDLVIDASEFPQLATLYEVMAVPRTVVNRSLKFDGMVPEDKLLEHVLAAAEASA